MFRFLIVTFLFATAYGGALPKLPQKSIHSVINGRIIGGEAADIQEAPYQVALLSYTSPSSFTQVCGGSIISPTVIATAAHCGYNTAPSQWKVRAGSTMSLSGGQLIDVTRIVSHESFDTFSHDHDIALFFLTRPITIDNIMTKIINLAVQGSDVPDGALAVITGWGSTSESGSAVTSLEKVTSRITNQQDCVDAYAQINHITARMICTGNLVAGGEATCDGDDGGPLAVNGALVGIHSWSWGCGRPGYPVVWTKVSALRNWIDQHL